MPKLSYKQAHSGAPTSPKIEIINNIYRDFLEGELQSVMQAFDENIDWDGRINWPGGPKELPYTGKKRGRMEVAEALQQFLLNFDYDASMSENHYTEVGNTVVVTGSDLRVVLPTGEKTENRWTMIWTIENGKAVKFRIYQDTVPELSSSL